MPTVLVVEDEESYAEALDVALSREGYDVVVARDGIDGLAAFRAKAPDLVLLDLMLPRLSGVDVCRAIRAESRVPIIMVTAKTAETDTVLGLELGADDYIAKPFRVRELVARIRAVLRRTETLTTPDETLAVGDVRVDPARHEVTVRGTPLALPLKEYDLLALLLANAGRVVSRATLIDRVWGNDYVGDTKTLDVHVKRLRAKLEDDPAHPARITTVRGVGYRYEAP